MPSKRLIARIRSEYPCLILAAAVAAGQLLIFCAPAGTLWFLGVAGLCAAALRYPMLRWVLAGVFPGMLSAFFVRAPQFEPPRGELLLRARIVDTPRRPVPGVVTLPLQILDAAPLKGDGGPKFDELRGLRAACRAVDLPWKNLAGVQAGAVVPLRVVLQPITSKSLISYEGVLLRRGYAAECRVRYAGKPVLAAPPLVQRIRDRVRAAVEIGAGSGERTALFLTAALGVRDLLSTRTENAFKRCGLAHLLVVSGYQITLFYCVLAVIFDRGLQFFKAARLRTLHTAEWISFAGTVGFIAFVGVEGSSLRAGAAALLVALSRALERGSGMLHSISVAFIALALVWPGCYLEPGVQLTFAALLGICAALALRSPGVIRQYLAVCWHASLFTAPVVIAWFGYLSLVGFVLNPLLAPLVAVLSCKVGFAALALQLGGVDPDGWAIGLVCAMLWPLRQVIIEAAGWSWTGWQLEGAGRVCAALVACLPILWIARGRVLGYRRQQGLA